MSEMAVSDDLEALNFKNFSAGRHVAYFYMLREIHVLGIKYVNLSIKNSRLQRTCVDKIETIPS